MPSRRVSLSLVGVLGGLLASSGVVSAHHSTAQFGDTPVTMEATVVEYRWRNPHVTVVWDAKDQGRTVRWYGELASIATVMSSGLTRDSLKPGDTVRVTVYASKRGTPECLIQYIERPDGTVVLGWSTQVGAKQQPNDAPK